MIWWIIGILIALIVLLGLTRVGIHLKKQGEQLQLSVCFGIFQKQIIPGKEKKTSKKGKKEAKTVPEKASKESEKKNIGFSFAEIRKLLTLLWPAFQKALVRFKKQIKIDPLYFSVIIAGKEDAAFAAELYGWLHAGVWTVMPILEENICVENPYIHVDLDFQREDILIEGEAQITLRLSTLVGMAWIVGLPTVKWLLHRKPSERKTATVKSNCKVQS